MLAAAPRKAYAASSAPESRRMRTPVRRSISARTAARFVAVRSAVTEAGMEYDSAESQFIAATKVEVDLEGARRVLRLVDALEDLDDVQNVFTSVDIPAGVAAQLDDE